MDKRKAIVPELPTDDCNLALMDPVVVPAAKKEEEQEGLLDKFGNALESSTGLKLTGAALVTALIISEVSRLIPVRNAVPVP